jgi:hypothetical protein
MPTEYNNIIVVTQNELVPAWFSASNLKTTIWRYKDKPYGIKQVQRACNGKPAYYAFDSLPGHIQDALGDPRKLGHILEKFYRTDGEAVIFFRDFRFEDGTALDTDYQDQYIINASVLKAINALHDARMSERIAKNGSTQGVIPTLFLDAISFNRTLKAKFNTEHTLPQSLRRFKDALKDFKTEAYHSLISGKFKNKNSIKVTDPVEALLNSIFSAQTHKPSPTEVSRKYNAFLNGYYQVINDNTGEIYNPTEFKALSDSTVKATMAKYQNQYPNYTMRSNDRQKDMQNWKPYHSLEKPKYAGSIISIDDRQPPFEYATGERAWFYNGIDLASEAFTCCVYGKSKSGIILDFYRQLVRNYAAWGFYLPAELEAELNLNASYKDTFLREGAMFQYVRIEANNARGKRIERYFRDLRYGIEKERTGWLARPFAKSESNQPGAEKPKTLEYNQIIENGLRDIDAWNSWPHSSFPEAVADFRTMGYSDKFYKTRWQVFMETQNPNLKPTNYLGFIKDIGYETKTSCRVGRVKLQGMEFLLGNNGVIATGESLINLMKQVEGEEIQVYWLDGNDGQILKAMIFQDTQFICEAIPEPTYQKARVEQTPEDEQNRALMSAYVSSIEAFGKQRRQSIEPVTLIKNVPEKTNKSTSAFSIRFNADRPNPLKKIFGEETETLPYQQPEEKAEVQKSTTRPLKDRF